MTPGIQELMREIERIWDEHVRATYTDRDVDGAMAGLAAQTSLVNVPVMTGGHDADGVRCYLAETLVPHLPADLTFRRVSRTVDRFRVVDEQIVAFTHDRELPWLLPGIPATDRHVEVLVVTIVTVRQFKILSQRALWDHAGLIAGLGLGESLSVGDSGVGVPVKEPAGWW